MSSLWFQQETEFLPRWFKRYEQGRRVTWWALPFPFSMIDSSTVGARALLKCFLTVAVAVRYRPAVSGRKVPGETTPPPLPTFQTPYSWWSLPWCVLETTCKTVWWCELWGQTLQAQAKREQHEWLGFESQQRILSTFIFKRKIRHFLMISFMTSPSRLFLWFSQRKVVSSPYLCWPNLFFS